MTPDDFKRAMAQIEALAPVEALPELRELIVGREVYEAFTTKVDRVHVDLEGPLGWFASQGVKVLIASADADFAARGA